MGLCGSSCSSLLVVKAVTADGGKAPIAGASVYFDCPSVIKPGRVLLGTTNAEGIYIYNEFGGINIHDGCEFWVEKDGYVPLHYAVHDVCTRFIDDLARHCESVKVEADLQALPN